MQLSTFRVEWTPPRTWFVTARLLEVAAAVSLVGAVWLSWQVYQSTSQAFGPTGGPTPTAPSFLDRVTQFAVYGLGYGQAPTGAVVASLLVLAILAILHFAQPVSHASVLRWEVFAVWVVGALHTLVVVASVVVALVNGDPTAPEEGTVTFNPGPGFHEVLLSGATVPLLCVLLLSVSAIWWLRLPVDFEAPEDEPETPVGVRHRRRPAPADLDDLTLDDLTLDDLSLDGLTLDGVELIEPVERLHPRDDGGDGSTPSGYDDYFRRF